MTTNRWIRARSLTYWREIATITFALLSGAKVVSSFGGEGWRLWKILSVCILVLLSVASVRYATAEDVKRSPLLRASPTQLLKSNKAWLAEPGQALVVTRDMSWVIDSELEDLLTTKSVNRELTLVVGRVTELVQRLRNAGAAVHVYDDAKFRPKVRFTFLRWGASDSRVIVHRRSRGTVEMYEVQRSEFPAHGLAEDLAQLLCGQVRTKAL